MTVAYLQTETEKKLTIDFHSKLYQYRLSLHTCSCVKFITENVVPYCSAEHTIRKFSRKKWMRLSSVTSSPKN